MKWIKQLITKYLTAVEGSALWALLTEPISSTLDAINHAGQYKTLLLEALQENERLKSNLRKLSSGYKQGILWKFDCHGCDNEIAEWHEPSMRFIQGVPRQLCLDCVSKHVEPVATSQYRQIVKAPKNWLGTIRGAYNLP